MQEQDKHLISPSSTQKTYDLTVNTWCACVCVYICVCERTTVLPCVVVHTFVYSLQGILDAGIDDDLSHSDFEDDDGSTDIEF